MAFIEGQSANLKGEIQLGAKGFVTIGGDGLSGSIEVIDTITVDPSEPAMVENMGTPTEVKLRFLIPRGLTGNDGYTPEKGVDYWTPTEVEEMVTKPAQAEQNRTNAENLRVEAESSREAAEQGRANAESDRASAEQLRAAAETERAGFYEGFNSELNSLKNDLSDVATLLVEEVYAVVPLTFDITGYYKNGNLSILDTSIGDSKTCIISVNEGDKYKVTGMSCWNQKLVCVYDASDNILLTIIPENIEQTLTDYEFTIPTGGVKMGLSMLHSYSSYFVTLKKAELAVKKLTADNVDFFKEVNPVNLYDYQSTVDGAYMNTDGTTVERSDLCYAYVPVKSGTYTLHVSANFFGRTNASRIPVFDANKNYLGYVTGTFITDGSTNLEELTITVSDGVKYIGLTSRLAFKNMVMVVSGNSMPTKFVPYVAPYSALDDTQKVNAVNVMGGNINPLYTKVVAFDGDSICHGTSAQDGKNGWAGRIGNSNSMAWKNYGISGGTITNNASHCILNSLNDIHTYMPTLDYYIFEGGTNDADILGISGIGTVTYDDYSGSYDTATFSGAFETLIYNALTFYPSTKIGYIVAQKMGKTNNANYANRKAYFDRAIEICKKWGIPYVDLWNGSHLNPNLSSMYDSTLDASGNISANKLYVDGQHLTPTGYDVITPIIEAWMKTL